MTGGQSADYDAVVAAARALLRTASRPTSGSATAQVNAAALDRLGAAVRDIPPAVPAPECTCGDPGQYPCERHDCSGGPEFVRGPDGREEIR